MIQNLALLIAVAASSATAQPEVKPHSRIVSIGGSAKEPQFTLDVSAAGRFGSIVVKDKAGAKLQTLTCDLFREYGPQIGSDVDFDFPDGLFVSELEARDLDFDGLPDIMALRDYTAQTRRYCVWLFDPHQGRFIEDALSRKMAELVNLSVDDQSRQIVAFTTSNSFVSRDEYRIDGSATGPRRLERVRWCQLHNGPTEPWTWEIRTYVDGREVIQRRLVSRDCEGQCGDGCPMVPEKEISHQ